MTSIEIMVSNFQQWLKMFFVAQCCNIHHFYWSQLELDIVARDIVMNMS